MKKTLLRSKKEFKGKVALQELKRAHIIIALLAFSLAFLIIVSSVNPVQLDSMLASIASALLIIVSAISASTAAVISSKK